MTVHRALDRDQRLSLLAVLLLDAPEGIAPAEARALLGERISRPTLDQAWLIAALFDKRLPTAPRVREVARLAGSSGVPAFLDSLKPPRGEVEVVVGEIVVDAHHTVSTDLSTGIQRVVRNVLDTWTEEQEFVLAAWTPGYESLRRVPRGAHRRSALASTPSPSLVLWQSVYLLPELAVERIRLERTSAMIRHSATASGVIGYDTVPMTSAETAGPGMPAAFSENLAMVAGMDRVATISESAAIEYGGWKRMLPSAGLAGPDIRAISLPMVAVPDARTVDARAALHLGPAPIVGCIGSHEPRKNHLTVLHAAELLWRDGYDFQLVFCGGNAWNSDRFERRLSELRAQGRPVSSHARLPDEVISAVLRDSRFTVFPSLNEGYGLPVAESLAVGTPVLTSDFGSMAEIAAGGGALMVDPRDDDALAAQMRRMLDDDRLIARLGSEAAGRPHGSWHDYSRQVWSFLVG